MVKERSLTKEGNVILCYQWPTFWKPFKLFKYLYLASVLIILTDPTWHWGQAWCSSGRTLQSSGCGRLSPGLPLSLLAFSSAVSSARKQYSQAASITKRRCCHQCTKINVTIIHSIMVNKIDYCGFMKLWMSWILYMQCHNTLKASLYLVPWLFWFYVNLPLYLYSAFHRNWAETRGRSMKMLSPFLILFLAKRPFPW